MFVRKSQEPMIGSIKFQARISTKRKIVYSFILNV